MAICNENEHVYLETDVFLDYLGASLLQMRDILQFLWDEVPNTAMLWP